MASSLAIGLLTTREEEIDQRTRQIPFDVGRLPERVVGATDWLLEQSEAKDLPCRANEIPMFQTQPIGDLNLPRR
jgi:hypothetical protein